MKCPFCKTDIDDTAVKCRQCLEFVNRPAEAQLPAPSYSTLQFSGDLAKAAAWPLCIVLIATIFYSDLSNLAKRIKSLEVGGTKSEFVDYAAAIGYAQEGVSKVADETIHKRGKR
jgi:hypothetical protein